MSESSLELVCRRARHSDLLAVQDIGIQYNGVDYIEARWNWFMSNPNFHCYVGEAKGKVVAFTFIYLVDDGESFITGGSRVHPVYRERGFNRKLYLFALSEVAKIVPPSTINNRYFVALAYDRYIIPPANVRVVVRRGLRDYKLTLQALNSSVTSQQMTQLCQDYRADEVIEASTKLVGSHIEKNEVRKMFPGGRFAADWHTFAVRKSNIEVVAKQSRIHITIGRGSGVMESVSFLTVVPNTSCMRMDVEIYHREGDSSYTIQHILKALQHFMSISPHCIEKIPNIIIFFPIDDSHEVDNIIAMFKWKRGLLWNYDEYLHCRGRDQHML